MKILVIGNGGREDTICKKLSESKKTKEIHIINGNAGTLRYAKNVDIAVDDIEKISDYAKSEKFDLCIVGPEVPLCKGVVDLLAANGIRVFGPDKSAARLEGSKDFAKEFMLKYNIPTAKYEKAESKEAALEKLELFDAPFVLKADGLCAGKGVKICQNKKEAIEYIEDLFDREIFGQEGKKLVIEDFLYGEEASLMCFVTKSKIIHLESARDYKKIYDGDKGDNTGGVGCYSPSELFTDELKSKLKQITDEIYLGLKKDDILFTGILFIGFMIQNNVPKILEFNVRFGDPETEVVLTRLKSDFVEIIEKALDDNLSEDDFVWDDKKCLTVVLTSKGYPNEYEKNKEISGIENVDDVYVYHNNTVFRDGKVYSAGGRALSVTGIGDSLEDIREKVYRNIDKIYFENKSFRTDIGKK